MDVIDRQDVADSAGDVLDRQLKDDLFCHQIDLIISGKQPESRPDFRHASDAIYPVVNDNIYDVISVISKKYGLSDNLNLNWIDTSGVTSMYNLFGRLFDMKIDVDISRWDVSNVKDMSHMFENKNFNTDISKWDVSSVKNMESMFDSSSFNGDISGWNIKSLERCPYMFSDSNFNRDISAWDVSHISNMYRMFNWSKMDRDLSSWNVSNVHNKYNMFDGTPMQNKREWWPKGYE